MRVPFSEVGFDMLAYLIFAGAMQLALTAGLAVIGLPLLLHSWRRYRQFAAQLFLFSALLLAWGCAGDGLFVAAFRNRIYFNRDPIGDFVPWLPSVSYMVDTACGGHPINGASWNTLRLAWVLVAFPVWLATYLSFSRLRNRKIRTASPALAALVFSVIFGPSAAFGQLLQDSSHLKFLGTSSFVLPASPARPAWTVDVLDCNGCEDAFPDDPMVLTVTVGEAARPIEYRFRSSYGKIELVLRDLTGDGVEELILVTGRDRGTYVRREFLMVLRLQSGSLVPVYTAELSDYLVLFRCKWWYQVHLDDLPPGIRLRLELDWDDDDSCAHADLSLLPRARTKDYIFDEHLNRLMLSSWDPR